MSSFDFLKEEFFKFTKKFKKDESIVNFSLETPSLELETFSQVHFNTKFELSRLNTIILSGINVGTNNLANSLEVISNISSVNIKYARDETSISKNRDLIKLKLTEISSNPASHCKFMPLPRLDRRNSFGKLDTIDKKDFQILLNLKTSKLNESKGFVLDAPNVERREFWVDLLPVNLNPIGPQYFKDISYRNTTKHLFLSARNTLERLREVEIETLKEFKLKPEMKCVIDEHWQKKCVVNPDTLRNDSLIEALQSNGWQIYERAGIFEGTRMIQVSKNAILLLMRLENLKKPTAIRKSNNIKVIILEIEDPRLVMEHGLEIIKLRDASESIYISTSLEQTFEFIEKQAGPFNFRSEETMHKKKPTSLPLRGSLRSTPNKMERDDENSPSPINSNDLDLKRPSSAVLSSNNARIISPKALLLRLFQSELFTAVQALHYLQKYSNEPGIQYYLCERLKDLPEEDVEILIPQLCHLVVMSTNESAPIEQFLLDRVKSSHHASIQILWLLENYLFDLKNGSKNAAIYLRTTRILLEVQRTSFKHEISESTFQNTKKQLIRASEHLDNFYGTSSKAPIATNGNAFLCTGPPIIAFGAMISALGCSQMVKAMHPLITMQTKKSDPFDRFHSHISNKLRVSPILQSSSNQTSSPCPSTKTNFSEVNSIVAPHSESSGPSLEELSKGKAFYLKRYISKTAKSAKTLLSSQTSNKSPPLPLMSNEMIEGIPSTPPATLFPSIPFYYHGDMQFISSLVAVSDRLVTLNRSNRLKALHAELCLINHNLPAPICVHSWCSEAGHGSDHHRILSILPYEASILNSAERVPFIIFIEILRGCSEDDFNALVKENKSKQEDELSIDNLTLSDTNSSFTGIGSPELQFSPPRTSPKSNTIATASGLVDISERMRTAAVMLAQLAKQSQIPGADLTSINTIRHRIIHEMETLEKDRLIDALQAKHSKDLYDDQIVTVEKHQRPILDKQDPSAAVFQEEWESRKERLARASTYSHITGWDVFSAIVKSSTDMRQELLAFQLVREYQKIFKHADLPIFLRPCKVLVASNGGGLIETVPNAISVHSIKKGILVSLGRSEFTPEDLSLKGYFIRKFGTPDSKEYLAAVDNFIKSLAGYSLLTYTLQIRDRHNGNILLDRSGNLIHIDFGFMLSNSPGYVGFESAPFKLTADYLDLLEGTGSDRWLRLKELLTQGLLALRKHSDQLISLLEALLPNSSLPCFYAGEAAMLNFKERLHLSLTDQQIDVLIDRLMTTSALNVFTRLYDNYQYYTNGIL